MNTNNKDVNEAIKEADNALYNLKQQEKFAQQEVVKYFDRVHDKLFSVQLFFLAAYISLVAIPSISISPWWLLIPILCIFRLIWIDYRTLKWFRKISIITKISKIERNKIDIDQKQINDISLNVIIETIILTILFMVCLFIFT